MEINNTQTQDHNTDQDESGLANRTSGCVDDTTDYYYFLRPDKGIPVKTFTVDGGDITPLASYGDSYLYTPRKVHIPDLETLAHIFSHPTLKSFLVWGWPAGVVTPKIRRLKRFRPNEAYGHTILADTTVRFFPVDVDGFDGTVDDFIALLPEHFHNAGYVLAYSSSHGIKPGLRCHLVFELDEPLYVSDLLDIAKEINEVHGGKLLDPAIYQPQQPFYCARPCFFDKEGCQVSDMLSERVSVVKGACVSSDGLCEDQDERWERLKVVPQLPYETRRGGTAAALYSIGRDGHHLQGYWYACCLARAGGDVAGIMNLLRVAFTHCNRMGKLEQEFTSTYLRECYLEAQARDAVREAGNV